MQHTQIFNGVQCQVSIIEHSKSQVTGKELVTYQLRYWRAVHAELLTHRTKSRNASSSRAIPTKTLLDSIREAHPLPVHWGANQPGMQAHEECNNLVKHPLTGEYLTREDAWHEAVGIACDWSQAFADAGYHKQIANRLSENLGWISVVLSATDFENWFELRDHADAQPDIRDVASTMRLAHAASTPRLVNDREMHDARGWHLPYVTMEERMQYPVKDLLAMSAARCARVSYLTHDKKTPDIEKDIALYKRLVEERPLHASPLEHQAMVTPMNQSVRNYTGGWLQHRALLETAGSIEVFHRALNVLDGTTV